MRAQRFYWMESMLVVGGVALVAFVQADVMEPPRALLQTWIVHGLFGAIYALIGSATTFLAVTRQRGPKTLQGR